MITGREEGKGDAVIDVATLLDDRYRVERRLGGGGMADVYEARDLQLDRDVAVKLLRGIDDPAAARRFAEEIRLTARLNHPNVVRLFDAGEHDGSPYLVLERVAGGTLASEMFAGPMDPLRVAMLGEQIANALEHAHASGVVHRDVKPTNVLVTPDGMVRLADFGIALTTTATRLTVAGSIAGSAGYVSPEQVLGTGAGAASDVYALGIVLLECLTGQPPWTGTTVEVALARITADPPLPDLVPETWRGLLQAMTSRRPEDRPTMGMAAAALADLGAGRASSVTFAVPAAPPTPPRRGLGRGSAVAALLLVLVAGSWVMTGREGVEPAAAAPDASGAIAASVVHAAAVGPPAGQRADATPLQPRKISTLSKPARRDRVRDSDRRPAARPESRPAAAAQPAGRQEPRTPTAPAPARATAPAPRATKPVTQKDAESERETKTQRESGPDAEAEQKGPKDSELVPARAGVGKVRKTRVSKSNGLKMGH